MFFCEFGDTALVARQASQIVGYLLGFVGPAGDGYIHLVAVRDDARTLGIGRRLYEKFAAAAAVRGATALKAITSPQTLAPDYAGSGQARIVMRRHLAG
jgi:ribosomal protein S18 acetylase RimI-like enzyme